MELDLSGGLDPAFEFFAGERPRDPQIRDSATLWILDESGEIALPRVTFDAVGEAWDTPRVQLNYVDRSGRTLRLWDEARGRASISAEGRCDTRGAGPLEFRCIEPFRRWSMDFEGQAFQSSTADQLSGKPDGAPIDLAFHIDATMAAPPWLMGAMLPETGRAMKAGDAGAMMGGLRYEQLCRVSGTVTVNGETRGISGTGMRVRRQGVRNMAAALGHCQHSALFPSGRAFGAISMAAGRERPAAFNEAFLLDARGKRTAARIVEAPWMTRLVPNGDDASVVLESAEGTVRIEGTVLSSVFDHHLFEMADTSILHQGAVRYVWDGEETIGLIERCTLKDSIKIS